MVIRLSTRRRRSAFLNVELVAAIGVLLVAMAPMAYSIMQEIKLARRLYHEAVAMQLLDGEMEVLAAGNWQAFQPGEHVLRVTAPSVTNLPPGKFVVVRSAGNIRVEWRPVKHGRTMAREVKLQ
jgi:hypothetical protein